MVQWKNNEIGLEIQTYTLSRKETEELIQWLNESKHLRDASWLIRYSGLESSIELEVHTHKT